MTKVSKPPPVLFNKQNVLQPPYIKIPKGTRLKPLNASPRTSPDKPYNRRNLNNDVKLQLKQVLYNSKLSNDELASKVKTVLQKNPEWLKKFKNTSENTSENLQDGTDLLNFQDKGEGVEIDSESTTKPFPTSQEYADEEVNFLMKKMKAYLYYPRGKTMKEKQADFVKHIERYEEKYQKLLEDIATEIESIIDKEMVIEELGGGKEMHGGADLQPKDIERLALLAIEYKRTIIVDKDTDDLKDLNKKTIGLTLTRINTATRQTEHNVLVQVPISCFDFSNIQRIQVGASKFEYGILSTRHIYYFNSRELEQWLRDKQANYEFPQLGTPTDSAKKISNIVFRNNIVEYEVTKKSILEKSKRYDAFVARLNPEEKTFLSSNLKHFDTLLLKTKNVDKVFVSLRFHPGNRGHIIYTIKQFFKNMDIDNISDTLDKYGVFQKKINGEFEIKDVFKNLGVYTSASDPIEGIHKKLNHSYGFFTETGKALDLKKGLIEEIKKINDEIEKKQLYAEQSDLEIEKLKTMRDELTKQFKKLDIDDETDQIKKEIQALIMPNYGKLPYTGLWFNLTIPGNHTWILFYVNGKFCSVGGGYNNDREYKLAFYSPDPVFDYDNHWLFPLMMNNWGFIDKNIINNLNAMAESIGNRTSEGFVTRNLKYSLLSNRLSSLCGYYNCASTADKILGQSIPMTFSHPSFSRGGEYTYTSQIFEALNIDSNVELVLSATQRFEKFSS